MVNIEDEKLGQWLNVLPTLTGSVEVLSAARKALVGAPIAVHEAIDQLEVVVDSIIEKGVTVYIDLGEMPGYHYHTGIVFAGYVEGYGKALGNGGRYDHVGEAFGRARPATGFAFDLKSLMIQGQSEASSGYGIFAPFSADTESQDQVRILRSQGNRVVQGFEGQKVDFQEMKCDRQIIKIDGKYIVQSLS